MDQFNENMNPQPEEPQVVSPEIPQQSYQPTEASQYQEGYQPYEYQPETPKKKGGKAKIIVPIAIILAIALAVGAYFLFFCGESVVGFWETEVEFGSMMREELKETLDVELPEDLSMSMVTEIEFFEDGTFVETVDEDTVEDAFENLLAAMRSVLAEMMYAEAEGMGMTREQFDEAMAAQGIASMDVLVDALLAEIDLESALSFAEEEKKGTYIFEDGKITLTYEDESSECWTVELDGDKMTLTGIEILVEPEGVDTDGFDIEELLPVVYTRIK